MNGEGGLVPQHLAQAGVIKDSGLVLGNLQRRPLTFSAQFRIIRRSLRVAQWEACVGQARGDGSLGKAPR